MSKLDRRDLLLVVHRLQRLVGEAHLAHGDDRNRDGFEQGQARLDEAHRLCIEALAGDPPMDGRTSVRTDVLFERAMKR